MTIENMIIAINCLELLANNHNDVEAMFLLGEMYCFGPCKNLDKGKEYYKRAAMLGHEMSFNKYIITW